MGYWVEISYAEGDDGYLTYSVALELPNGRGIIKGTGYGSWDEAEFATSVLIESWN